ncbi:uncharacterized protein LOC114745655 [Neltuma alba]|uniref:uncharacterized protein LOC114745655 n=1 Tax=Neltuma alba TaxID=207710 RepID=UPI0010A4C2F2|nr:uncharacterized protein LOC114745655 [Prosopis alba]
MKISRGPGFDASNNITEPEITPSTSGVQMTKEHGSHSLARGGSTSRENSAEFVSKLDGHMEGSSGNNMKGISSRKRGRGIIKFTKLGAHHGATDRMHVEFDDGKNPLGAEGGRFISYIGFIAQSKVGILFPNWKSVPETTRDTHTYDVPPTHEMKKHWLQQVHGRWKDFKTILTRVYIQGAKNNEDPRLKCPFLDQETWRKFVESRQDPEFQKLSVVNKERQSKNLYQRCMSRGGYKKVEQNIMQANLKTTQEVAKSNPGIIVQAPSRATRHQKWKEGRIKKGQYINPKVAEIAGKIDALEKQSSQGSFTQKGRMDILATAIGKLDHLGRVREVGKTIGLIQYFGPTSRSSPANVSKEEITAMVREQIRKALQEICQSTRNEIIAELHDEMRTMVLNGLGWFDIEDFDGQYMGMGIWDLCRQVCLFEVGLILI